MRDVMIDLETMGSGPSSAIVALGAVCFDPLTGEIGKTFYCAIDLRDAADNGGVMDPDTVIWWLKQSDEARAAITSNDTVFTRTMLDQFTNFLYSHTTGPKAVRIWGNGSDFDNVILKSTYDRLKVPAPWSFWNNRCYRTLKGLFPQVKLERSGTHHNALDDAMTQAVHAIEIFKVMRGESTITATPRRIESLSPDRACAPVTSKEAIMAIDTKQLKSEVKDLNKALKTAWKEGEKLTAINTKLATKLEKLTTKDAPKADLKAIEKEIKAGEKLIAINAKAAEKLQAKITKLEAKLAPKSEE